VQPREPDEQTSVFNCVKTVVNSAILTTSATLPINVSKQFQLNDVDDYTDLTSVFDQYRIKSIECYISPQGSNQHGNDGKLTSVIDFDDAASLTGVTALDFSNAVTASAASNQYRHFIPHAAAALYNTGAVFTGYANVAAPWIDAASPAVPHFGLKLFSNVAGGSYPIDLVYRLHLQFRNTR
jgi:hypothetical protein